MSVQFRPSPPVSKTQPESCVFDFSRNSWYNFIIINKININHKITAPELRVLDEAGANLGVMKKEAALALAQEKGLDLIEVSPNAKPPVARIMSFDKYRYQEEKKLKKQRAQQKIQEFKQIQISVSEAKHDLERKAAKADEFLKEGHRVEILMVLRGRQKAHKDWAKSKLEEFIAMISTPHTITMPPHFMGRGFTTQVVGK